MLIGKRQALLWGPLFLFIVAFVLHVNQMFIMFAALGLLGPVSYALGRRKLAEIRVDRYGRSVMTAGERGSVHLTVRNDGRLRQFFVVVRDQLPDGLESPEGGQVLVADLPAESDRRLSYDLLARRRGVFSVGPPVLEASDYLGLYRFTRKGERAAEVLVYPRAIPIPNLWPRALSGRKPHKASRRVIGPSTEFFSLRDYLPGDDLRHINWKSSAKRDKLTVVQSEQIEANECVIAVDLSAASHAGTGDTATVEYAATLAASLANEALGRGSNVGLIAQGKADHSVIVSGNPRQHVLLLESLARIMPDAEQSFADVVSTHEDQLPPGSVVAVISPTVGPEAIACAARLRALGHPVSWFAIAAHTFPDSKADPAEYESTVAGLAAHGFRVYRITGDVPLETSLWRRAGRGD